MKSHKHPSQRVGIFVDASNMYFATQNLYKANLNYKNVLQIAVAGRQLVRAFAYVIETESNKERDFFSALTDLGYETRIKPLQIFQGGAKKGDWDVGLTIDVVRLLPLLDTVVLVSGDGDYIDLIDSKMNSVMQAKRSDQLTGHWSGYIKHLDRMIFKDELPSFVNHIEAPFEQNEVTPKVKLDKGSKHHDIPLKQNLAEQLKGFRPKE